MCSDPSRPNIIFLLTDDQRDNTFSAMGHPFVKTPAVDALLAEDTLGALPPQTATLSATGQDKIKHGFDPVLDGFDFVPFNDAEALRQDILDALGSLDKLTEIVDGARVIRERPHLVERMPPDKVDALANIDGAFTASLVASRPASWASCSAASAASFDSLR